MRPFGGSLPTLLCMNSIFRTCAQGSSRWMGTPSAFVLATASVILWAVLGPVFDFSTNWQLVINTGTTILTFLMVFLIQNTQNRDATAIHLKLDELIESMSRARNSLIDIEDATDEEMESLRKEFAQHREHAGTAS